MDGLGDAISAPLDANIGADEMSIDMFDSPAATLTANQSEPREMTVILQLDRMQLARTVFKLNNEETQRVGMKLSGGFA